MPLVVFFESDFIYFFGDFDQCDIYYSVHIM